MKKLFKIWMVVMLCLLIETSCQKTLEPQLKGSETLETLVSSEEGINSLLNSSYAVLQDLYKRNMQYLVDLASDDSWTWRNELDPDMFIIEKNSTYALNPWVTLYRGIGRANIIIDNIENPKYSSVTAKNTILGQAKFLRAYYYFNLVRLYGGVPLIVKQVKTREDSEQPRATIQAVYAQIKADLKEAETLLPNTYSGATGQEIGRATGYTASALLATVYLELQEWKEAENSTKRLIGVKSLLNNYADNFNGKSENGPGSFFEVQYGGPTAALTTTLSNSNAPTSMQGSAGMLPTDDNFNGLGGGLSSGNGLVQAIEVGDLRKSVILADYGLANFIDASKPKGSLFYLNKFYNSTDPVGLSTWNYPLIRYAEVLLIRAEALNESGYVPDGEAFSLINQVRAKAGLQNLTAANVPSQEAFRTALQKERRIELCFESKRYFDLNRWTLLESTIQKQMDFMKKLFPTQKMIIHPITNKKYFLFPIPSQEFSNNAFLGSQNPGYN